VDCSVVAYYEPFTPKREKNSVKISAEKIAMNANSISFSLLSKPTRIEPACLSHLNRYGYIIISKCAAK
jgi:hypothetical protein